MRNKQNKLGKKINIAVLMGGPSVEHEVSLKTGRLVLNALDRRKYRPAPIVVPKKGRWQAPKKKIDVAFIAMHGTFGEDGAIQALLESAGIPYTGSGVLSSALAMNKIKSYELFTLHELNVPKHIHFSKFDWKSRRPAVVNRVKSKIGFPCVVKPANLGSSVGVSMVKKFPDLESAVELALRYTKSVLVDVYIKGREVTCGVLDHGDGRSAFALPPTEIIPKTSEFFDYRAKYEKGASDEITPARFPKKIFKAIQNTALNAHQILGCSGMSRTDMIVSGSKIYVLEINTIPGMTETSLLPQAARAAGISFRELLDRLIIAALAKK